VIVTTHPPLVLANFDVNEISALDGNSDGTFANLTARYLISKRTRSMNG
jgi:hypothetical protein